MGTLTANEPRLAEYCDHKLPTSCRLTSTPLCCACADNRNHSFTYSVYVDGVGLVQRGTRWQSYCWFCKTFWTNRLAGFPAEQSRIPHFPDQTDFIQRWYDFHRGYKLVESADGGSPETVPVVGIEPLCEAAPGELPPMTSAEHLAPEQSSLSDLLSQLRSNDASDSQPTASLAQQLDDLLAEADEEGSDADTTAGQAPSQSDFSITQRDSVPPLPTYGQISSSAAAQQRVVSLSIARDTSDIERRLEEARSQLEAAQREREEAAMSLENAESTVQARRERFRRLEREQRRQQTFARIFGTREEIEQQGEAYESPIGGMFSRAFDRYRRAEEARMNPPTAADDDDNNSMSQDTAIAELWSNMDPLGSSALPRSGPNGDSIVPYRLPSTHDYADEAAWMNQLTENSTAMRRQLVYLRHNAEYHLGRTARWRELTQGDSVPYADPSAVDGGPMSLIERERRVRDVIAQGRTRVEAAQRMLQSMDSLHHRPAERIPQRQYGLDIDDDRPEPKTDEEMTVVMCCQICYTQLADSAVLPCGHLAMCVYCADQVVPVREDDKTRVRGHCKCPVCRKTVKKRVRVYVT
ncbi:hypothetical protein K402DRAFT_346730 [Aulographum hederae CBS 113979]|uniref:RING-type domain-containing protein n=1 Tax=Aulographum hederae CBS 113979 TaxID=1176131 RepID=A0A6G1HD16_9PEZI|nr:hypothetical protein K402DRAFT_346730 [Aulographum hederae CBS 113979]